MKNIRLLIGVLLFLPGFIVRANPVERIILKNGSVLEGYISNQHPGKDITFLSERSTVYLPSSEVKSMDIREYNLEDVSAEWQNWAKENGAIRHDGKKSVFKLAHIVRQAGSKEKLDIRNVRILEQGAVVKYLDLSLDTFFFDWKDVEAIERDKRDKAQLNGLNDLILLKSSLKELEGQIIRQVPGELVSLLKTDGVVEVLKQEQIIRQKKVKINPEQSLFEQSQLLDIVRIEDGRSIKGIVVDQYYGTDKEPGYLLVQTSAGETKKVEHKDIREMQREENPEYKEKKDILLNKGDLYINRKPVTNAIMEEDEELITILPESVPVVLSLDSLHQELVVETRLENEYDVEGWLLLPVSPKPINKKESRNGFTYKEMITNGIHYTSKETSVNGTTRLVYPLTTPGYYVVYAMKGKRIILCLIK